MRQAITTKYLGPTNFHGARIKATAQAGSVTIPWDYAANTDRNHEVAARALCVKVGWTGKLVGGFDAQSRGVFVLVDDPAVATEGDFLQWMGATWRRVD